MCPPTCLTVEQPDARIALFQHMQCHLMQYDISDRFRWRICFSSSNSEFEEKSDEDVWSGSFSARPIWSWERADAIFCWIVRLWETLRTQQSLHCCTFHSIANAVKCSSFASAWLGCSRLPCFVFFHCMLIQMQIRWVGRSTSCVVNRVELVWFPAGSLCVVITDRSGFLYFQTYFSDLPE